MPAAQIDLFRILFEEIFKISSNLIYKYPAVQDQLLYLLLIPHVVLILFLIAFSRGIVGRVIKEHRGIQNLVAIVAYIYIVMSGWYGTLLVPLLITWFYIAIIVAFFIAFISIVWHPAGAAGATKLVGAAAGALAKQTVEKTAKRKELEKERDLLRRQILKMKSLHPAVPGSLQEYQLNQLELKLIEVEEELRRL